MCGFAHYGARYVYGDKAYRYEKTQQPWRDKRHEGLDLRLDTILERVKKGERFAEKEDDQTRLCIHRL